MQLTIEEFNKIRTLNWQIRTYGNKLFNVTDTPELFWFDFIKNVFANYFQNQQSIHQITNFDVSQAVLIDNNLNLQLPTQLKTVVYLAKNQTKLKPQISIPVCPYLSFAIACVLFIILIIFDYFFFVNKI